MGTCHRELNRVREDYMIQCCIGCNCRPYFIRSLQWYWYTNVCQRVQPPGEYCEWKLINKRYCYCHWSKLAVPGLRCKAHFSPSQLRSKTNSTLLSRPAAFLSSSSNSDAVLLFNWYWSAFETDWVKFHFQPKYNYHFPHLMPTRSTLLIVFKDTDYRAR